AAFTPKKTQTANTQSARKPVRSLKENGRCLISRSRVKRKLAAKATPKMDRSAQFQSAVNAAARAGMTADQLEAEMRQHPTGCASKYLENGDRLRVEIDRSWGKVDNRSGHNDREDADLHDTHRHHGQQNDHGSADADPSIDGADLLDRVYEFLGRF